MKLTLLYDHRFYRDGDGVVFSTSNYNYELFRERYLRVFDEVAVLARVSTAQPPRPRNGSATEGPGVSVVDMGSWSGLRTLASSAPTVVRRMAPYTDGSRAVICIVPGRLSWLAARLHLRRPGRRPVPYGVEMIGDPGEQFAPGAHDHGLRPALRQVWPRQMARVVGDAAAVAYVSEETLRPRFPPGPGAFVTHYSSIDLPESAVVAAPRPAPAGAPLEIAFIGSLEGLHKGPDVLLDACARCVAAGIDLRLTVVGSGSSRGELEELATRLAIADRVRFEGQLPAGEPIRAVLDRADLFVLPSLTEGLPRVVIEAMARGLPVLASDVGGIVELLPAEDRFPPRDPAALARALQTLAADPQRSARMSVRNLARSRDYLAPLLQERRLEMYRRLAAVSAAPPATG